jgi:hypothetical protein
MSVLDLVKKGFGYVLLSMGVSRPQTRTNPSANPAPGRKPGLEPTSGAKQPGPKA